MPTASINFIYGAVLAAALLHAVWNAIIKRSADTLLQAVGVVVFGACLAALTLPWVTQPCAAAWLCLPASLVLQVIYMRLLARIYRVSDLSLSYPVMRGTAPLLVALASSLLTVEAPGRGALLGIVIICAGVLCIGLPPDVLTRRRSDLRLALLNAVVIMGYTLVDGVGVRLSGAPAAYTLWEFLLLGIALPATMLRGHSHQLTTHLRQHWRAGLLGGFGSLLSYGIALWAMTLAPIATVAALRETSILFGVLISGLVLHERLNPSRLAGAGVVVTGIVVLRLSGI